MEHIYILITLIIICAFISVTAVAPNTHILSENFENTSPYNFGSYSEQRTKTIQYFNALSSYFISNKDVLNGNDENETNRNIMKTFLLFPTIYDIYCTKQSHSGSITEEDNKCKNNYIQNMSVSDINSETCVNVNSLVGQMAHENTSKVRIFNNVYHLTKRCLYLLGIVEIAYIEGSDNEYLLKVQNNSAIRDLALLSAPLISFQEFGLYRILNTPETIGATYTNYTNGDTTEDIVSLHLKKMNNPYIYPIYDNDFTLTKMFENNNSSIKLATIYYFNYLESILSSVPLTQDYASINNAIYTYNNIHISYNKKQLLNNNNILTNTITIDTSGYRNTQLCTSINITFNRSPETSENNVFIVNLNPNNPAAGNISLPVHKDFSNIIKMLGTSITNDEVIMKISVIYTMDILKIIAFYKNIQTKEDFVFITSVHGTNILLQYKISDFSSENTTFSGSYEKHIPNLEMISKSA